MSCKWDLRSGTEYKIIQLAHSSALYSAWCLNILREGLPNSNRIFFLFSFIFWPISSQEDFGKMKGSIFELSLKNWLLHNLNICDATFSKNRCIISMGKNLRNSIDCNSNKMLFSLIPKIK